MTIDKKNVIIVIPVYKERPNREEISSFKQCLSVLSDYDICIETYKELNLDVYKEEFRKYKKNILIECFDKRYFLNTKTYSELLMSRFFYERFRNYRFMLLYQLDAWVFKDELLFWCQKNYDYIGAPWFEWCYEKSNWSTVLSGEVGNGGFSLRKISYFLDSLQYPNRLYSLGQLFKKITFNPKTWASFMAKSMGFHNSIGWLRNLCIESGENEDFFFCKTLNGTKYEMHVPLAHEALSFSFEINPEVCFYKNGNRMPFGCHGFGKYKEFWKKYINCL